MLVIGAGEAGLRAAIEASASGVRVGMVTKSLLGKAYTVMAEDGIAAALANVDEHDDAIIPLKQRVVDQYFDPLRRLFRVFKK